MKSSKLPVQAMPVERTITGATLSSENGVNPSFDWGGLIRTAAPIVTSLLGSI